MYLFGNPNTKEPICGYKIVKKYVVACGAKNPDAITSTRLRKHLATLTQLFNMTENDIEQLANFMGHTVGVHRGSYRLPNDVFQVANISKLLVLMEKGEAGQYKGKSLDEINIDFNDDLGNNAEENNNLEPLPVIPILDTRETTPEVKLTKQKRMLVPWTGEQKKAVCEFFKQNIKRKIPPKKQECLECKEKFTALLENKDWLKIKVFIHNVYTKKVKT